MVKREHGEGTHSIKGHHGMTEKKDNKKERKKTQQK